MNLFEPWPDVAAELRALDDIADLRGRSSDDDFTVYNEYSGQALKTTQFVSHNNTVISFRSENNAPVLLLQCHGPRVTGF